MIVDVKLSTDQTFNVELTNGCPVIETPIKPPTPSQGGKDGLSAYEIAVKNGFEGSETEWLASLVGPRGPAGGKGDKGDSYILTEADKTEIGDSVSAEIEAELNAALLEIIAIDEELLIPDGNEVAY